MKYRPVLNGIALLLTLLMNWAANRLPLNGQTTGEISADLPVLFTPAPYAFGIWGLIYLTLMGFCCYQALPAQRHALFLNRLGNWFIASCVFNCLWLLCWHYRQFGLTILAMLGLLSSLWMIYRRLDIGRKRVSRAERLLVHLPFRIYLGWISVATLANVAVVTFLFPAARLGLPPVLFTNILLLLAAGLGVAMLVKRNDTVFSLVIVWALIAIAVRHQQAVPGVAIPAAGLACLLVITLILLPIERTSL